MNLRPLSLLVCTLGAMAWSGVLAQATPVNNVQVKVYGAAQDASGNITPGCNITPFTLGSNMGLNGMSTGCVPQAVGPFETTSQSASDIATALVPYQTQAADAATMANYSTTSQMNAAIAAGSYAYAIGYPTTRTLAVNTAYQGTTTTKPAKFSLNFTSSASISLTTGATNTVVVYIGSTTGVASGTGTAVCVIGNGNTGALTVGLALTQTFGAPCIVDVPAGGYLAYRVTAGAATLTSAFDQAEG